MNEPPTSRDADPGDDVPGSARGQDRDPDEIIDVDDEDVLGQAINAPPDLADEVRALREHVTWLTDRIDQLHAEEELRRHEPAPWVTYSPPAAAGHPPHENEGPGFTITNFVAWYNITYTGLPGTRARAIPGCWPNHPGLVSEIATLAYAWHDAFTGPGAHPHKAQLWHHHDRPGFAERLSQEWTHPHCHDDAHKPAGAAPRRDRHGVSTDEHAADNRS